MKSIVFFHPDLGIGGAERLIVDAAVGLQSRGHRVTIYTSYCDKSHCFDEVKNGTLDVRVRGDNLIPPSIFGRFSIFCAIARQVHLVLSIALFSSELQRLNPTHLIVDQLSASVPLLRVLSRDTGILFYCHFPDKLLAQRATGLLGLVKLLYRIPFNALESWSTDCSDQVVVNSNFTGKTVKQVFPALRKRHLQTIYPCVDTATERSRTKSPVWPNKRLLLSINRFEGKKDAALAVRAFAALPESERQNARLVIAGGYDPRLADNVSTLESLQNLAERFGLRHETVRALNDPASVSDYVSVLFLPSISDSLKQSLLDSALLLVYTPRNEHFGIVPLEAMLNAVPVLAANEGGPVETVVDGETGWLRDVADTEAWTEVYRTVLDAGGARGASKERLLAMGRAGQQRVKDNFSKETMARRFDECLDALRPSQRQPLIALGHVCLSLAGLVLGIVMYILFR